MRVRTPRPRSIRGPQPRGPRAAVSALALLRAYAQQDAAGRAALLAAADAVAYGSASHPDLVPVAQDLLRFLVVR